jgi:hypothetical protein
VIHGGLRAWEGPGPYGGPPYVTPILRAGLRLRLELAEDLVVGVEHELGSGEGVPAVAARTGRGVDALHSDPRVAHCWAGGEGGGGRPD